MGDECVVYEPARLTNLSSRVHHISCLDSSQPINLNMGALKKFESLRTLLEFARNVGGLPSVSSLRALRTSSLQLTAVKNLTHLRYLNISHSNISELPNSICRLQKLQTLKLEDCQFLYCLPKDLTRLQDLRHLVINRCRSLVATPPKIGMLTCLRTLNIFIVGSETGFGLAELHGLKLGGKLHIKGLENVRSERDAREANLIGKKDLNCLYLTWGSSIANSEPEKVIEALEPPSNLKSFGMDGYKGIQLPSWMRNTSFLEALVDVKLYNCENCQRLPPLGKFPHLKTLFVSGVQDVKYMDDDLYDGVEEKAFPSLKKLTLRRLPNLERMMRDEGVEMLPRLCELRISGVPKFKLPWFPSVEYLYADDIGDVARELCFVRVSNWHGGRSVS